MQVPQTAPGLTLAALLAQQRCWTACRRRLLSRQAARQPSSCPSLLTPGVYLVRPAAAPAVPC